MLTPPGVAIAEAARPASFLAELPQDEQADALVAALGVLGSLQAGRGFRTFGECKTCSYFQREGGKFQCGFTLESLTDADSLKICREHKPAH